MCRHCWRGLGLGVATYFAYFETRAFKTRCHRTLSREVASLGPAAVMAPLVLGALATWHLLILPELEQPPCSRASG